MEEPPLGALEESLLRFLLTYRGHQVRFEADSHTTEFGIFRSFPDVEVQRLKNALRSLEMSHCVYRRVQYVIGFTEPKLVFSLTPNGYRKALDLNGAASDPSGGAGPGTLASAFALGDEGASGPSRSLPNGSSDGPQS
jgi:hypothetical protein